MKCSYINLDTAPERREWMESGFARINVQAERMPAVAISRIRDFADEVRIENAMTRPWIDGEIACFLSHRECWKRIAEGPDAYGAVFEDDVHLSPHAGDFLRDADWIPRGVELVKLETVLAKVQLAQTETLVKSRKLRRLDGRHLGAAGYIISRDAAMYAVSHTHILNKPIDHVLFGKKEDRLEIISLQLIPALCIQDKMLLEEKSVFGSLISESSRFMYPDPAKNTFEKFGREIYRPIEKAIKYFQKDRLVKGPPVRIPFA